MDLNKKMQDLIKESLPEKVGAELRKVLEQAEIDKKLLSEAVETNKSAVIEIDNLNRKVEELQAVIKEHDTLYAREKAVEEREKKIEITLLENKLAESEKRATMVQDFTSSLVRNTVVRKSILDSKTESQMGYNDQNGMWVQPGDVTITKQYNETKIEE